MGRKRNEPVKAVEPQPDFPYKVDIRVRNDGKAKWEGYYWTADGWKCYADRYYGFPAARGDTLSFGSCETLAEAEAQGREWLNKRWGQQIATTYELQR